MRPGAAETAPCFRRLSRPLAEEERVSVRLFKVGFLECRGQDETGPAGAVFGKDQRHRRESTIQVIFLDVRSRISFILHFTCHRVSPTDVYHFQRELSIRVNNRALTVAIHFARRFVMITSLVSDTGEKTSPRREMNLDFRRSFCKCDLSCNRRVSFSVCVSDVTASHAEDVAGFRFAALLLQG